MMRCAASFLVGCFISLLACPPCPAEDAGATEGFRFISTWPGTIEAVRHSRQVMLDGGPILDAVEQGVRVQESNADDSSVGLGGTPNAAGVVQLDACIMYGPGHAAGAVAGVEGVLHPISLARKVMELTPHVMLVGHGAREFAIQQGLETGDLLTEAQRRRFAERQEKEAATQAENHDTIALLAVGADGTMAGGCSTSGWGYKLPGRVGDSPILGSGLYVDNEVGAAGATGTGENVMRYCGTFMVVEGMRHGLSPQQACEEAIRRIVRKDPLPAAELHINFLAMDKQGRFGAAGTDKGFQVSVADEKGSRVVDAKWLQP